MGRRRRRGNRNRKTTEQGELLEQTDGASAEGTAADDTEPDEAGRAEESSQDAATSPDDAVSELDDATAESEHAAGAYPASEAEPPAGKAESPAAPGTVAYPAVPDGASVVLGSEWWKRVAELEDIHDLEGALAVVRGERTHRPDDLPLLQAEIRLLGSLGRFDAAEEPLSHLRQVAEDPALVHRVAGVLLFRRGTYPEAMEELRASVGQDDSVGETFYYLGETLNRLGRVEEALEALRRAVQLDPGLGRAYSTMGRLLDQKGEPAEAAVMHRKAREAER